MLAFYSLYPLMPSERQRNTCHFTNTLVQTSSTGGITMAHSTIRRGVRLWVDIRSKLGAHQVLISLGNVTYLDQPDAVQQRLTYVNDAGRAIIKVDNSTTVADGPLVYRNSVRPYSLWPSSNHALICYRSGSLLRQLTQWET